MIYGIGTDICDIRRVRASLERRGARFAKKILTPAERHIWQARSVRCQQRGVRFIATRFSAKEAFSKAIGLGLRLPMRWQDCEITTLPSGQRFEARRLHAHLSLSDESDYAVSFCLVLVHA